MATECVYGRCKPNVIFCGGMFSSGIHFDDTKHSEIEIFENPIFSSFQDLYYKKEVAKKLQKIIQDKISIHENCDGEREFHVHVLAHSYGGVIADAALGLLGKKSRKKISVITFGSMKIIENRMAGSVVNYLNEGDEIAHILNSDKYAGSFPDEYKEVVLRISSVFRAITFPLDDRSLVRRGKRMEKAFSNHQTRGIFVVEQFISQCAEKVFGSEWRNRTKEFLALYRLFSGEKTPLQDRILSIVNRPFLEYSPTDDSLIEYQFSSKNGAPADPQDYKIAIVCTNFFRENDSSVSIVEHLFSFYKPLIDNCIQKIEGVKTQQPIERQEECAIL